MALRIQNNVEAFNAHRNLSQTESKLGTSMERLSSGYRINRAADDAAGLAISERLRGQINGLDQSQRNAQDAVSLVQTAEGSLTEVHAMLQRVRELAVQYKNGSLSTADRTAIQSEVNQLASEIERIGSSAQFNGINLLNSSQTISVGDHRSQTVGSQSSRRPLTTSSFKTCVAGDTHSLRAPAKHTGRAEASRDTPIGRSRPRRSRRRLQACRGSKRSPRRGSWR